MRRVVSPSLGASPLGLHAQLASNHADQVLAVDLLVSLFEEPDLLVGAVDEELVEEVFVSTGTDAGLVGNTPTTKRGEAREANELGCSDDTK